jgi:hypothetical protein
VYVRVRACSKSFHILLRLNSPPPSLGCCSVFPNFCNFLLGYFFLFLNLSVSNNRRSSRLSREREIESEGERGSNRVRERERGRELGLPSFLSFFLSICWSCRTSGRTNGFDLLCVTLPASLARSLARSLGSCLLLAKRLQQQCSEQTRRTRFYISRPTPPFPRVLTLLSFLSRCLLPFRWQRLIFAWIEGSTMSPIFATLQLTPTPTWFPPGDHV